MKGFLSVPIRLTLWLASILSIVFVINSCHRFDEKPFVTVGNLPEKSLIDTAFNRLFDQQILENIAIHECPGMAVLVLKNNQVIFEKEYGTKSRYSDDMIDTSTIFRLGSVSKGFAGILAAILIDKNMMHHIFVNKDCCPNTCKAFGYRAQSEDIRMI